MEFSAGQRHRKKGARMAIAIECDKALRTFLRTGLCFYLMKKHRKEIDSGELGLLYYIAPYFSYCLTGFYM